MSRTSIRVSAVYVATHAKELKATLIDISQVESAIVRNTDAGDSDTVNTLREKERKLAVRAADHRNALRYVAKLAVETLDDSALLSFILPNVTLVANAAATTKEKDKAKAETVATIKKSQARNDMVLSMYDLDSKGQIKRNENGNPILSKFGQDMLDAALGKNVEIETETVEVSDTETLAGN